jgi:hypothetical protein
VRRHVAALGIALCLAPGCAYLRRAPEPAQEYADCGERREVLAYFAEMQAAVRRGWIPPRGAPPEASVELAFVLDAKGLLTSLDLVGQAEPHLATSALAAVRRAQPFPEPYGETACLVGKRVVGTFSYQATQRRSPQP